MKVSIEEFLKSSEFPISGTTSVVDHIPNPSSNNPMDFEATAGGHNFHDLDDDHDEGLLSAYLSDHPSLLFGNNGGFEVQEGLEGPSWADDDAIGRDEEVMRYEGRVTGNDNGIQSNMADNSNRMMMRSNSTDHDYVLENIKDEDDEVDSGINSSPQRPLNGKKTTQDGQSNTGNALRSGLRPRVAARKRCFSSSSFTDGESDEEVSSPVKRQRKASGAGSLASTRSGKNNRIQEATSSTRGSNSKNAIAARENREKKKQYVQGIEESNEKLRRENKKMKEDLNVKTMSIEQLSAEVTYLRGILSNVDEISALIRSVRRAPGITSVTTSLGSNLRTRNRNSNNTAHNENLRPSSTVASSSPMSVSGKQALGPSSSISSSNSNASTNPGVCFHIRNGAVSLEFCSQCSRASRRQGVK